ncbi:MAG: FGGY-family carbohydrate kinase, partial [bacterium]
KVSEKFLLGIDAGTSVVKAIIFDEQGEEVSSSSRRLSIETAKPGWAEQDMNEVWQAVRETIQESLKKSPLAVSNIAVVGISGQGDGCRLVDKHLKPVRKAILWLDGRAGEVVTNWEKEGTDLAGFRISGSVTFAGAPAAIIKWLEKNEPHSLKKAKHFLFAKDWIKLKLSGKVSTDPSDASRAPLNIKDRVYSDELFKLFGLSAYQDLFPKIIPSFEVAGEVTSEASEATGLKEGTPIISGMIDVVATPVGLGAIYDGQAFSIVGTTCFNAVVTDQLILEPLGVGMTLVHGLPDKFIRGMPSMAGTPNLDWFIKEFCGSEVGQAKKKEGSLYEVLEEKVKEVPLGSGGVLYHPYINPGGERAPFVKPSARAQFFGISLRHTRWHLLRSVYEGVALSMLDCFKNIPVQISELALTGGGAKSSLWCQIFADVTGKTIKTLRTTELGALGAAIGSGVGIGIYPHMEDAVKRVVKFEKEYYPRQPHHQKYQKFYQLYQNLYRDVWANWDVRSKLIGVA